MTFNLRNGAKRTPVSTILSILGSLLVSCVGDNPLASQDGGPSASESGEDSGAGATGEEQSTSSESANPGAGSSSSGTGASTTSTPMPGECELPSECSSPPEPECVQQGRVLKTYRMLGDCIDGSCKYESVETACIAGCDFETAACRSDVWLPVSHDAAPAGRGAHTQLWADDVVLIWGGQDACCRSAAGAIYDPVDDKWSPMPEAPQARAYHSAVWTGSDLIVWGGTSASNPLNTGHRYNLRDGWVLISSTGAPSPRTSASAVWTGQEMIVWGGRSGDALGDGARYNPTLDSWADIATEGDPTARYSHSAIWTGEEMIIWGGYGGNGRRSDGRRYRPAEGPSGTWLAVSESGLSARSRHTATWTGSEMIIWGGAAGDTRFNDGKRYDPGTNSWAPMTTEGAPSGRSAHEAIWTGQEMIVWGGSNESEELGDGGRYDPRTDTWTPMSLENAPEARYSHGMVWTGDLVLVWGGRSPGVLATGRRYVP